MFKDCPTKFMVLEEGKRDLSGKREVIGRRKKFTIPVKPLGGSKIIRLIRSRKIKKKTEGLVQDPWWEGFRFPLPT